MSQQGNSRYSAGIERDRFDLSIEQSSARNSYSVWVPAIEFDGGSPATYQSADETWPSHWVLPGKQGGEPVSQPDSKIFAYIRRPQDWQRGHIEPILHMAFVANPVEHEISFGYSFMEHNAAVPAFTWNVHVEVDPTVDVLYIRKPKDTLDTSFGVSTLATGVINPVALGAYDPSVAEPNVPPDHKGLYFGIRHNSDNDSDPAGDIRIFGVELIFVQHEASIGTGFYGDYYLDDTALATF